MTANPAVQGLPIPQRPHRAFLSHAHTDKPLADAIHGWCVDKAGIKLWYDTNAMRSGSMATSIREGISTSQAGLLLLSKASVTRHWVEREAKRFLDEHENWPDFQIVPILVEDCEVPSEFDRYRYIDMRGGFTAEKAVELLEHLHSHETKPQEFAMRAVYMARGSRAAEVAEATKVVRELRLSGLRVIRDAPQRDFDLNRLSALMEGCHGMVAVVPDRGGKTTPYILIEILLAIEALLPLFLVVEGGLSVEAIAGQLENDVEEVLRRECGLEAAARLGPASRRAAQALRQQGVGGIAGVFVHAPEPPPLVLREASSHFRDGLRKPRWPAHCFLGHVYRAELGERYQLVRRVVQSVAGIPCSAGSDFRDDSGNNLAQSIIVDRLRAATFAIFDVSNEFGEEALNTCIEAGIAIGADVERYLVAKGPERDPVFMLRNVKHYWYKDDLELAGLACRIASAYRRVTE